MKPDEEFRPSRAMLPGEFLCAGFSLALAWSASGWWPLNPGPLHRLIAEMGQTAVWVVMFGAPSMALLVLSMREWLVGKSWGMCSVAANSCYRSWMVAWLGLSWLYALYLFGKVNSTGFNALIIQALFGFIFCGWSFIENRRVRREASKNNGEHTHGPASSFPAS